MAQDNVTRYYAAMVEQYKSQFVHTGEWEYLHFALQYAVHLKAYRDKQARIAG